MNIPERLTWAIEQLAVQPHDEILEIGCGTGVAAALICAQLTTGHLTAIDRSPTMIRAAQKRNQACIESGKAIFLPTSLAEMRSRHGCFNKALAVNINLFWLQPVSELEVLKQVLKPTGEVCLIFQPPVASKLHGIAEACSHFLLKHGFSDISVDYPALSPMTVVCVRATLTLV